uniref:ABC transporter TMD0 domain-containing protein n=1 Tax=Timema tahoe TaxID=61484 RepID=A0A7R9FG07_9NEOP|nr:unnamed protein product [Timema tahoe]
MDAFCGSTFWDANLTWYTEDPDLTPCFQKTVLIWLPCALLWGLSPLEAYYILGSRTRNIAWNSLNVTKLVITSSLIFLCASDLGFEISRGSQGFDVFSADYLAPLVKMASLALAAVLQYYNRTKGIRTSGILFLFWLLSALCGLIQFRHEIRKSQDQEHAGSSYLFVSYVLSYMATIAQLVLNFFVDAPPRKCKYETIQPNQSSAAIYTSPDTASVSSQTKAVLLSIPPLTRLLFPAKPKQMLLSIPPLTRLLFPAKSKQCCSLHLLTQLLFPAKSKQCCSLHLP